VNPPTTSPEHRFVDGFSCASAIMLSSDCTGRILHTASVAPEAFVARGVGFAKVSLGSSSFPNDPPLTSATYSFYLLLSPFRLPLTPEMYPSSHQFGGPGQRGGISTNAAASNFGEVTAAWGARVFRFGLKLIY
jgi:hypothetical protein